MSSFVTVNPMSPKKIDKKLKELLGYLDLNPDSAQHLKFTRPASFIPEADQCHFNVWCQIREEGGKAQPGWMLAQDKRADFAEAIFHSVWRTRHGRLLDVTPRKDDEKRILFVPDNSRAIALMRHEGRPAIRTFQNAKMHYGAIVQPPEDFVAVIGSDFPERMGLWPW